MAIIYQNDKRSGITYAYDSHSYWDKEKKTSRATRKLIGRLDPTSGEIIPTDGRCRKDKPKDEITTAPDYKALYVKLQKKCIAQEALIKALREEIHQLKEPK